MSGEPQPEIAAPGANLTADSVLRTAPGVAARLDGQGAVWAEAPGGDPVECGPRGFAILDAFAQPASLAEALAQLGASGPEAWIAFTDTVARLIDAGVLRDPNEPPSLRGAASAGFGTPAPHVEMLDDMLRTGAFLDAIRSTVREGDVVVEIGTGTGVLAVAAARAGARRVFAIEGTPVASAARLMFEANGVDDRVELVEGWSHDVVLPEPATVLVAEIIGNDPFAEQALESFLDARARLLTSNARLIPRAVSLVATPVQVPVSELERWTFGPAATERWGDTYDLGFDALTAGPGGRTFIEATLAETAQWPRLGPPVTLVRIDLALFDRAEVDVAEEARIERDGRVTGVLLSFDLDVAEGIHLTTSPGADPVPTSWHNPVWLFPDGRSVGAGERLLIRYRRGAGGEWGVTLDGTA